MLFVYELAVHMRIFGHDATSREPVPTAHTVVKGFVKVVLFWSSLTFSQGGKMNFREYLDFIGCRCCSGRSRTHRRVLGQSADQPTQGQPSKAAQLEEVVVTGIRASLQNAEQLKKNSDTIQDSIVAEDIGKLPDVTAVEALQRITGVQIGRDLGEGGGTVTIGGSSVNSGIEIRGLPQVETTLNGREVFSATGSRVLNFEDIPSSLLAGIDVYKDPTADLLEGGIGGTVDLRTHKPFDFQGLEFDASAAAQYGDMVGTTKPEFTLLTSDRWETDLGEVGALLSFGYQDRSYREDVGSEGALLTNKTVVSGQTTYLPNGALDYQVNGDRQRTGLDGVFQWRPSDDLETYAEISSQELRSYQSQYEFLSYGNANVVPGSVSIFSGTNDASAVSYTNAQAGSVGAWRQVTDVNRQAALNAKWTPGSFTVVGDVSYTKGYEHLENPAVFGSTLVPEMSESTGVGGLVATQVTGIDLTNINNYTGSTASNFQSYMYDTIQHFDGDEKAAKLDGAYTFDSGFLNSLQLGIRFADRVANYHVATMFGALTKRGPGEHFAVVRPDAGQRPVLRDQQHRRAEAHLLQSASPALWCRQRHQRIWAFTTFRYRCQRLPRGREEHHGLRPRELRWDIGIPDGRQHWRAGGEA